MPWWIWLLLALFMLTMIVIGCVYVVMRGVKALHVIGDVGARMGRSLDAMSQSDTSEQHSEPPLFTQPLRIATDRYERAHIRVIERKDAQRVRHAHRWAVWSHFND
ncbi:hypothetical protein D2E25_0123 [Bifidobacterium goeldii]|uniref:Uncharacterized protein n=1 Tax=Bifidobacterium goeldii TaxID=2306975 RepID=A0A430FLW0_9BIFI|nr:hypothetical protein [Bifidobacterium goeldii]RSX53817.1 hypothetical protein D2E25_0123 [Bifidobacterium goeldii]